MAWLRHVVTEPLSELTRWQRAVRFAYDLGRFGARQLRQDNAPQMAGALAFRTLFGLIPVVVVATVLLRAFRGIDQLALWAETFFSDVLGLDNVYVSTGQPMSQWIVEDFLEPVQELNFTALGWVGVAVLVYSAIGLMVTIEDSFNAIYRVPSGRTWARRVPIYWTVLTLGPLALGLTDYLHVRWSKMIDLAGGDDTWQGLLASAPFLWRFVVMWIVLVTVYKLIPNTRVSLRPVLVGAFVTALLLELGRQSLGAYVQNLKSVQYLYGSLGLIPLFMFWVYLMWLVVLFGSEVSATLQALRGRRLDEVERQRQATGLVDPAAVVLVTEVVAEEFLAGRSATAREIADTTGISEAMVQLMFDRLVEAGVLHRVSRDEQTVTLAKPVDQIGADLLVQIGHDLAQAGSGGRRSELVQRLRAAQKSLASQLKLEAG
jgi:membrane protein